MRTNFFIIILTVFFFAISCKENSNDSLEYKKNVNSVLDKINRHTKQPEKIITLDSLYAELLKKEKDTVIQNLMLQVAYKNYILYRFEQHKTISQKVLNLAKNENNYQLIAKSLSHLGEYYEQQTASDSTFYYYDKAEKYYAKVNDSINIGRMKLFKAGVLLNNGVYSQSESEGITSLKYLIKSDNPYLLIINYNVLAISLKEMGEYEKALKYYKLGYKLLDHKKFPKEDIAESKALAFNNIASVYVKSKNYNKAIEYYEAALKTKNIKTNSPQAYAFLADNLGHSLIKSGKSHLAGPFLFDAKEIWERLNYPLGATSTKINLGEYFLAEKDSVKGLKYLIEGYNSAQKIKSNNLVLDALELLMNNDKTNKNYYTQRYIQTKDSLQQLERVNKNKFVRIAYETEEIEKENKILSKRNAYLIILAVTLFGLTIFVIFFFRLKAKNKQLLFIQEQQEANEKIYQLMLEQHTRSEIVRSEERNRIAMELHDGIVNSIFTTRFNLSQLESEQSEKKSQLVAELEIAEREIRRVSHDLQQNLNFSDNEMVSVLNNLIDLQQNLSITSFDLTVDKFIEWTSISDKNKIHLYRIIQEAVQNVHKYAKAEKCFIFLLKTGDKTTLRILDNGIGFSLDKTKEGIGLKNIRQRVQMMNGELKIESSPDNGTYIEVIF